MENAQEKKFKECPIPDVLRIESLFTFFRERFSRDYVFPGEYHDFTEAVCVTDGCVGVTADKTVYTLPAGRLIVHGANEFHKIWSVDGEPEAVVFSFAASAFPHGVSGVYTLTADDMTVLNGLCRDAERIFDRNGIIVERIKSGQESEASVFVKRLETFLIGVLTRAATEASVYKNRSAENYFRIVSVMENNIGSKLCAAELARLCAMSVPALEKTVKKFAGTGAAEHFTNMKIRRATELLREGKSVKHTALALGFNDQNYFSAVFKKRTGVAPTHIDRRQ